MYATDSGYYFFKFSSREECNAVLEGGPWHVGGQPIILKNWHVGLELTKEAQSTIPIWVNIYNIPLEYWNPEDLGFIASAIGKPLHVHKMTATCQRLSFARLCIEVSAEFELPKDFEIEFRDPSSSELSQITLRVEYQWNPVRCAKCKKFGHNCATIAKPVKPQVPNSRPSSSHSKKKLEEGVWMVAKGKNVVDLVQEGAQSSPTILETIPRTEIESMGKKLTSGQILMGSEVVSPDTVTPSLRGTELKETPGVNIPASTQSGEDSLVTSIIGTHTYTTNVHGVELQKNNQFAMLSNIAGEGNIEGQDEGLGSQEVEIQRSLKTTGSSREQMEHYSPSLLSGQLSGEGQHSKNKARSSSGK